MTTELTATTLTRLREKAAGHVYRVDSGIELREYDGIGHDDLDAVIATLR